MTSHEEKSAVAVILCKDERMSRFLEIELTACGVRDTVRVTRPEKIPVQSQLWLVDFDDFPCETLPARREGVKLYGFARKNSRTIGLRQDVAHCFDRPVSMRELEAVLTEEAKLQARAQAQAKAQTQATLQAIAIRTETRVRMQDADMPPSRKNSAPMPQRETLRVLGVGVVAVGDDEISLTPHEWAVFNCLFESRGETVSKSDLREVLDGVGHDGDDRRSNTPEVYICFLRRKLEKPTGRRYIDTVRGVGYRMNENP